jgi:ATP-dependent DNA helicase RecG
MKLQTIKIDSLVRTSGITLKKLKQLDIHNYWDLINYFPYRYENYSLISSIAKLQPGETVTVMGQIVDFKNQFTKTGFRLQKAILKDATGQIMLLWYNQIYLSRLLKKGQWLSVAGKVKVSGSRLFIESLEYEFINKQNNILLHTGRLVPIYLEKNGLSSKTLREKIYQVLNGYKDWIEEIYPQKILRDNNLITEAEAYLEIHFPKNLQQLHLARKRLGFDELFLLQLNSNLQKQKWEREEIAPSFSFNGEIKTQIADFISQLPFELTLAQKKCWQEIVDDLTKNTAMNRFLQGDVGSGKTIIAALACYLAYLNHYQAVIMAPTEILAKQHFQSFNFYFASYPVKIALHTGSVKTIAQSQSKDYDIVIGTQALISEKFSLPRLGLVIIDEQHRFGVFQRALLKQKGNHPHLLTMTATPIPRTVALTFYGELKMSIIDQMPKGRLPVKTYLVPQAKRSAAYLWIKNQIKINGTQVFIVCPLIEESEVETLKSVKAVLKEYDFLANRIFPEFKVGLLHGKLKAKEKDKVMQDFKDKKYDILLCTPVVEVGVDVPNASIMLIEAAERFGLAQLHQLRGRVGRGTTQAYCYIFTEKENPAVTARLNFFAKTNSGIALAEYDLKKRGPGEIYGLKQHGYLELKIASLNDYRLIEKVKRAVEYILDKFKTDLSTLPALKMRLEQNQRRLISRD